MALATIASGTQVAVIGTEHDLATDTAGKTYVLKVDASAMVLGDVLELRIYDKVLSGGAEVLAHVVHFSNVQGQPSIISYPFPNDVHLRATLKQVAGTGRSFPWKLLSLD